MGMVIEMYCLGRSDPLVTGSETELQELRMRAKQVSEVSLNSAAMPMLLPWLLRTPLANLFNGVSDVKGALYFAPDQLDVLENEFPSDGPDGADGVIVAVEDALCEARWRNEGLWIGTV